MRRYWGPQEATALVSQIRRLARPLRGARDLDPLIERVGNARQVFLGEASHGTSEYYTWRTRTSQRLIEEKGFSFIAVEGDWPDCYRVNRYVKGYPDSGADARKVLETFERWPSWMWANEEVVDLVEWLRQHNDRLPEEEKVGFYGLDVYSLWESMEALIDYLEREEPEAVPAARRAYKCFEPYGEDVREYARATAFVPTSCEDEVVDMLSELRSRASGSEDGREARLDVEQNALVTRNAETYYRTMVRGGGASWNVRDRHMVETLERLMHYHELDPRAIVWEHNTHIGDARATDMAEAGMVNVGQLAREKWGERDVVLVGLGSYKGSVVAGAEWGAPMQRMPVPPAREGSWEDILHRAGIGDALLILAASEDELLEPRAHRAIGVVYDPTHERYGNYVPTMLGRRYDAFIYLDETQALNPLRMPPGEEGEAPETYPSGV